MVKVGTEFLPYTTTPQQWPEVRPNSPPPPPSQLHASPLLPCLFAQTLSTSSSVVVMRWDFLPPFRLLLRLPLSLPVSLPPSASASSFPSSSSCFYILLVLVPALAPSPFLHTLRHDLLLVVSISSSNFPLAFSL